MPAQHAKPSVDAEKFDDDHSFWSGPIERILGDLKQATASIRAVARRAVRKEKPEHLQVHGTSVDGNQSRLSMLVHLNVLPIVVCGVGLVVRTPINGCPSLEKARRNAASHVIVAQILATDDTLEWLSHNNRTLGPLAVHSCFTREQKIDDALATEFGGDAERRIVEAKHAECWVAVVEAIPFSASQVCIDGCASVDDTSDKVDFVVFAGTAKHEGTRFCASLKSLLHLRASRF